MNEIVVIHRDEDAFAVLVRDHVIQIDQPSPVGSDAGPSPVELFVAALAACAAHYARRHLEDRGLPYNGLSVAATYRMAAGTPHRVTGVRLSVRTPILLHSDQRADLLAAIDRCTVHNSLRTSPDVQVEIEEENAASAA